MCVCASIAVSVVRFHRNALYCARQHLISEAVETSLIDLNCDGAIKIADLKSNIFRSALKMTILFHAVLALPLPLLFTVVVVYFFFDVVIVLYRIF